MVSTKLYIVLAIFSSLLIMQCKPKRQEIPPVITLRLQVVNEKNVPVKRGTANVYLTKETFDAAFQSFQNGKYTANGSAASATVINGNVSFSQLPAHRELFVLAFDTSATFMDTISKVNTGIRVRKDNTHGNFKLSGYRNGSEVTGIIRLQSENSLIKFDNTSGVNSFDKVQINNILSPVLNSTGYYPAKAGAFSYFIRTDDCIWQGTINVPGGNIVYQKLASCPAREYSFQALPSYFSNSDDHIAIYLGQNRTTPVLILRDAKVHSIVLENPGINGYTYSAVHSSKPCVWFSTITANNILNNCN